jgi:hypothetical protein
MSIENKMMHKKITPLLFAAFFSFNSMAAEINILDEAQVLRKKDRSANIEISQLTEKYLPKNMPEKAAIDYLSKLGFVIFVQKNKSPEENSIAAVFSKTNSLTGFGDEIRIFVNFSNGKVKNSSGKIIFRSL